MKNDKVNLSRKVTAAEHDLAYFQLGNHQKYLRANWKWILPSHYG